MRPSPKQLRTTGLGFRVQGLGFILVPSLYFSALHRGPWAQNPKPMNATSLNLSSLLDTAPLPGGDQQGVWRRDFVSQDFNFRPNNGCYLAVPLAVPLSLHLLSLSIVLVSHVCCQYSNTVVPVTSPTWSGVEINRRASYVEPVQTLKPITLNGLSVWLVRVARA